MSALEIEKVFNPLQPRDGMGRWTDSVFGISTIREKAKATADALAPIARKFDIRDDVKPNGKRVDGVPGKVDSRDRNIHVPYNRRNTFCYVYSGKFFKDNPDIQDARLVHGYTQISRNVDPINHSWVEFGDKVFEPNSGHTMTRKQFDKFFKPKREVEYTREEFMSLRRSTRHWGPWHEDDVTKALPLWDGDGVQGAGQPRDRHGRWIRLPGPTDIKKIGFWELEDGTFGVFKNGEEEPFKTYKTRNGANKFVQSKIKDDVKEYKEKVLWPKRRKEIGEPAQARQQQEMFGNRGSRQVDAPKPKTAGRKGRQSKKVVHSTTERLDPPGKPTQAQFEKAKRMAREQMKPEEAKYAELVARLLWKRGITQDPSRRGDIHTKYQISPGRQVEIEAAVYDDMFPNRHGPKPRKRNLSGGVAWRSDAQDKAMTEHGAIKAVAMWNDEDPYRPARMFKATKGPHRGQYVRANWNGTVTPISEDEFIDEQYEAKIKWAQRLLSRREQNKKRSLEAQQAQKQADENERQYKIRLTKWKRKVAGEWAKSMGYDPKDTAWHAIFWNDNSLLSSRDDQGSEGDFKEILGPIGEKVPDREPTDNEIERILALPDIDARDMRGSRPDSPKARPGDEDFEEASPESRMDSAENEDRNEAKRRKHNRRISSAYARYKTKYPKSKISLEEFAEVYFNAKMTIPGGSQRGKITKSQIDWDGDGVQGAGQLRGPDGRWVDTGGAVRAFASHMTRSPRGHAPTRMSTGRGAPIAGAKKSAFSRGVLQVKLNRLPRSGKHVMEDQKGKPLQRKRMTAEEAITARNVGPDAISNQKLKKIWEDLMLRGKKPTGRDFDLIVSAGGQNHIDGDTENIKTQLKSGNKVEKSRAQLFTMIRSQLAAGSGDRSYKREGISDESREKAKAKRAASLKMNSETQAKKRIQLGEIFSEDGRHVKCIFCGGNVRITQISLETIKPKEIGGTYSIGNMVPSHQRCNTSANRKAQNDPAGYWKDQKNRYAAMYSATQKRRHTVAAKREG